MSTFGGLRPGAGRSAVIATLLAAVCVLMGAVPASAALQVEAEIDGVPVDEMDAAAPLPVARGEPVEVVVTVRNDGEEETLVKWARLEAELLWLPVLAAETDVAVTLEPGRTETIRFRISFSPDDAQATGLYGAELGLFDVDRTALWSSDLVVEIDEAGGSVFGWFTWAVLILAVGGTAATVVAWVRRVLPTNRLVRGLRFGVNGLSLGLAVVIAAASFRWFVTAGSAWVWLLAAPALTGLVVGYLVPGRFTEGTRPAD